MEPCEQAHVKCTAVFPASWVRVHFAVISAFWQAACLPTYLHYHVHRVRFLCVGSPGFLGVFQSIQTYPHDQEPAIFKPHADTYDLLCSLIQADCRLAAALLKSASPHQLNALKNICHQRVQQPNKSI
ncbi:hypothetical protein CEP54_010060 [Fusarium duplospermum]|uniref:Uncharacterized protein n=1 Tax=Fusarium duplospermum TaxID=1325734 RepID=A0A428PMC8_9HYPO|nr:hypothetical protein CEP54_010060 [Fusarium duplospermum]